MTNSQVATFSDNPGRRVASGLSLATLSLASVYWGGWPLLLLVMAAAMVMVGELNRICGGAGAGIVGTFHYAVLGGAVVLAGMGHYKTAWVLLVAGALYSAGLALQEGRPLAWPLLTPFYLGLPCLLLFWMRNDAGLGAAAVYFTFATVWASDTFAYALGRAVGGPRFSPQLSPKKTWAGFVGGCLGGLAVGAMAARFVGAGTITQAMAMGLALSLVSQGGDLLESAIKRNEGLKDSGSIVPGHGGLLDTVDGLLTALPVAAFALFLLGAGVAP